MSKVAGIPWQRALAEFLVIFAGITLSLLADDWRQSREDAQRERSALLEMVSDLEADSAELAPKVTRLQSWEQAALWVQRHAGRKDISADSVSASIRPLLFIHHYRPVRSTYEGLRTGGDLDLVRDDQVRRLIVEYYELHQARMIQLDELIVQWYNALWEATQDKVLWTADPNVNSFLDPDVPEKIVLLKPWPEISGDPAFVSKATMLGLHGAVAAPRASSCLQDNSELRFEILKYLR